MEAGGGQAEHCVPGLDPGAVDQPVAGHEADAGAGEVDLARSVDAGHLGALAAEDRAAGLAADRGGALDELRDLGRVERVRGDVVEEEERVGARRQHVVDAVGGEVCAGPRQAPRFALEHDLRPDPVRRGCEQARLVERVETRERPELADDAGRPGGADGGAQPLDDLAGLCEGDTCFLVGALRHRTYPNRAGFDSLYNPEPADADRSGHRGDAGPGARGRRRRRRARP